MPRMTPERARLLGELLTELAADPSGYIPDEAWLPFQKAVALPYLELAIVRRRRRRLEILLSYRVDAYWEGWHIPGGLWRTPQTLEQAIDALAKSESLGARAQVSFLAKGEWEKWHDHKYGYPISHIAICRGQNIRETQLRRWFSAVPDGMIDDHGHHARFIEGVFRQVEQQQLL